MAKEYNWDVSFNGENRRVCCVPSGNKYTLYVDDAFVTNVYREPSRKMRFGLETEVDICGRKCLFIVWDERPDLVIDGVMLSRNTDYLQARKKRKQGYCKFFRILFWAGLFWICAAVSFALPPIQSVDVENTVKAILFGIMVIISAARYERKWKQW